MLAGIYSAASGMDAAALRHTVASANLANIQSPGYLRRVQPMSFDGASGAASGTSTTPGGGTYLDVTSGPRKETGRPLDLAIAGDGFFVVAGPDGPLFTRNGSFQADPEGRIVTIDGLPVRGTRGDLVLPAGSTTEQIVVQRDGVLKVGRNEIGQLELASFEHPDQLLPSGASLFAAPPDGVQRVWEGEVVQGYVEQSNVSPMIELVGILAASRQYEASQQAMKMISSSTEKHVNSR